MPKINRESLAQLRMPVPPLDEQQAIANFLDFNTSQISELITKKQDLTAVLLEKRTALISRVVIRGLPLGGTAAAALDVQARLKPSGVDWMGRVPAHWRVGKLKYFAAIESGHTPSRSVEEYWTDGTVAWVSLNDSRYLRTNDYISDTAFNISELGLAHSPHGFFQLARSCYLGMPPSGCAR